MSDDQIKGNPLIGVDKSSDVAGAAGVMIRENIGALGVYDGDELLGILTERDVTRVVSEYREAADTPVHDAMTIAPLTVEAPISSAEAAELMRKNHVRHLILKEQGADRIISIRDL